VVPAAFLEDFPLLDFLVEDLDLELDLEVEDFLELDLPLDLEPEAFLVAEAFLLDLLLDFLPEVFCLEDDLLVLVGVVYPEAVACWSAP